MRQRRRVTFVNVGDDFDWSRFFRGCHPSADGYAMIAAEVDSAASLAPLVGRAVPVSARAREALRAASLLLGPVVAKADLGGARGWSIVLAGFSLGGVLGTFVVARIRPRRPMVLAALLFQGGTLFTLMLAVPFSVPMMALAGAVLGVTFSVITVLWDTLLQVHVPPELLARVYSYDFLGSTAAIPIGTAVIGTLASNYGAREVLIGAAVLQGLAGLVPLLVRGVWKVELEKAEVFRAHEKASCAEFAQR